MADHFVRVSRVDNGASVKVWFNAYRQARGRPDQVKVFQFDLPGGAAACKAFIKDVLTGAVTPTTPGTRYIVEFWNAPEGVVARQGTETPALFALPAQAQALRDWVDALA